MLTISLSTKGLRISFARSVEAAGNNEPPLGTTGLQVRREAQDFWRGMRDKDVLLNLNVFRKDVTSLKAKSPKGIASLSSTAAGLLQSFITSFASSVSHKSLPQARYRLCRCVQYCPPSPDLKAFPLHLRHCRSSGSAPSLPNLPRAGRVGRFAPNGETV